MFIVVLKILVGIAVYVVVVLAIARFCATNTISEEREKSFTER